MSKDVGKFLCILAAVALLPCFQNRAQAQYTQPQVTPSAPLSGVRYDNRWEVYGGVAYSHFNAGPDLVQGANLGGFDAEGTRWFTSRWGVDGSIRGYYGTSGTQPNPYGIRGPFVSEYLFVGGPEYRGPSNQHITTTIHALFGGAHGGFESALYDQNGNKVPPANVGFYNNQTAFGSALGGTVDLNRSSRLAFRISPDAILTNYSSSTISNGAGIKAQFAISVGLVYRLGRGKVR
ncbi:MAG TPA: hypothetical protein VE178_15730 [Silvibacterium sp.]|nr:hypothetical protein [Silvibacterium sp.]